MIATFILSFATLATSFKAVFDCIREIKKDTAEGLGYTMGALVIIALLVLLITFMFKSSLKLIRTKVETEDSIDEIGL